MQVSITLTVIVAEKLTLTYIASLALQISRVNTERRFSHRSRLSGAFCWLCLGHATTMFLDRYKYLSENLEGKYGLEKILDKWKY
jgi:hypothetical protein